MRIGFRKLSDERHLLEIRHDDGRQEERDCETKSYLVHDFLHYAVESEAGLSGGFWGRKQSGEPLSGPELLAVEQVVGALSAAVKGASAKDVIDGVTQIARAAAAEMPRWLTEDLIACVQARMRELMGRWKATRYREKMELVWPRNAD